MPSSETVALAYAAACFLFALWCLRGWLLAVADYNLLADDYVELIECLDGCPDEGDCLDTCCVF